jgi:hypothetical protein
MDIKRVLKVALSYAVVWLGFMLIPAVAGQPEVITATPFGLILPLTAGTGVYIGIRQKTPLLVRGRPLTLTEALLAGALVGAFQGLLFAVWVPILMVQREGEQVSDAMLLLLCFLPIGTVAGGLLGAIFGVLGCGIRTIGKKFQAS